MSTLSYSVSDKGLAVKLEEIDIEKFRSFIILREGQDLMQDDDKDTLDVLREFLCDDCQFYLGSQWSDGVICHKWTYGNDIYGDFTPLINGVAEINVDVENDDWVIMCLPRYASLFERAYESEDALITEMKFLYGKFLPENFNYRERLASLCAVVWG